MHLQLPVKKLRTNEVLSHLGRVRLALACVTVAVCGVFVLATVVGRAEAQTHPPKPQPPITGGVEPKDAIIVAQKNRAMGDDYLLAFVASGRDPRSLPLLRIEAFSAPAMSLETAAQTAEAIVRARVATVTFAPNPSGGLPYATVSLVVREIVKVPPNVSVGMTIKVLQLMGPIPYAGDGAFAYEEIDEPLLPGDEVVLLLDYREDLSIFQNLVNTGVYHVGATSTIRSGRSNPFRTGVDGRSAADLVAELRRLTQR